MIGINFSHGDKHSAAMKGKAKRGSENGQAKLCEKSVAEILRSAATNKHLAKVYRVSATTISSIRRRKTWKHVNPV